ncbi:hypothetical protein Hanom_Chr00s017904g01757561 [Helianthus anomalus]
MLYCISGSVFTYGMYFRKCRGVRGVLGVFVLTLSIVTQFHIIPTSRDRTPTNLGRALTYVTGPYVTWTGHQ